MSGRGGNPCPVQMTSWRCRGWFSTTHRVTRCSVRPSVCLSVTRWHATGRSSVYGAWTPLMTMMNPIWRQFLCTESRLPVTPPPNNCPPPILATIITASLTPVQPSICPARPPVSPLPLPIHRSRYLPLPLFPLSKTRAIFN